MSPLGLDRVTVDALGWTLVSYLWQGGLIALGFALIDRALSRASASVRYLVGCGTLLLMLAVPVGTLVVLRDAGSRTRALSAPTTRTLLAQQAAPTAPRLARSQSAPRLALGATLEPSLIRLARADRWRPPRHVALFPWLVAAWGAGVFLLSLRLLGGWWLVRRIRGSVSNTWIPEWQPRLEALSRRIGVSRPVRLLRSALVQVPTAIGWLHPVILLPASTLTGLTPRQIESILAHELAHIRRHDYLVNLLQCVVETLLFYHPGVWWVSRRIREERELCCDDLAVEVAGDPLLYADALHRLERLRGQTAELALAASGGSLLARIARLLATRTDGAGEPGSRGLAAALGTGVVIALMIAPAMQTSGGAGSSAVGPHHRSRLAAPIWPAATSPRGASRAALPARAVAAEPAAGAEPARAAEPAPTAEPEELTWLELAATSPAPAATAMAAASGAIHAARASMASAMAAASRATATSGAVVAAAMAAASRATATSGAAVASAGSAAAAARASADVTPTWEKPGSRSQYSVDEWIALSQHGVTAETVAGYETAGLRGASAADLIALANNGVAPEYVARIRRGGLATIGTQDLIRLAQNGVTPEYVNGIVDLDAGALSSEDLIRLANNGVTPEWFAAMRWMGYPGLTVDRAIRLAQQGISPEFASQLQLVGRKRFTLDELEEMRRQGVDAEYVARMEIAVPGVSAAELIQLQQQGVDPGYAAKMRIVGHFGAPGLIALRQQGVEPEFAFGVQSAGYKGLSVEDMIRMRQNDVSGEFIEQALAAGYPRGTVSEMIRLRQQGIPFRKGEK